MFSNDEYKRYTQALTSFAGHAKRQDEKPRGGTRSTRRDKKDEFERELEEQLKLDNDMHQRTQVQLQRVCQQTTMYSVLQP